MLDVFDDGQGFKTGGVLMHEAGIAFEIAEVADKHARGRRIKSITVQVGTLAGVVKEALGFHLDCVLKEKYQKIPKVIMNTVHTTFRCVCGTEYEPGNILLPCPACGKYDRELIAGQDCTVETIEVEDE